VAAQEALLGLAPAAAGLHAGLHGHHERAGCIHELVRLQAAIGAAVGGCPEQQARLGAAKGGDAAQLRNGLRLQRQPLCHRLGRPLRAGTAGQRRRAQRQRYVR
jgi:hypothetical protein